METPMDDRRTGTGSGVTTVEIWELQIAPELADIDLTGYTVEAADGKIGKVDEHTRETGGSSLVVDTGPWIFGKKVMLPAGIVARVDPDSKSIFVQLTKDEIKNAPEFDEDTSRTDADYRRRLGDYYGGLGGARR